MKPSTLTARSLRVIGLLAVALPATATAATATAVEAPCSGKITVTLSADNSSVGAISKSPTVFGGASYTPTTVTDDQETFTFVPGADGLYDVTVAAQPRGFEYLGALSDFRSEPTPDIGPGSDNVAFLTAGDATLRGATPSRATPNFYNSSWPYESAVYTLDDDLQIGMRWVNEDGSTDPTSAIYSANSQFVAFSGDVAAARAGNLSGYDVREATLTLVPDAGADCGQTPPDTTAPTASITAGPADGDTVKSAPTYEFTSNEDGSTFECAIDDGDFADCTSPYSVDITDLPDGDHIFFVRATDAADNISEVVSRDFTLDAVDKEAPAVIITSGPADGATVETAPTYEFTSTADDVARFECAIDDFGTGDTEFTTCTSPYTPQVTEDGSYIFAVRAFDTSNNRGNPTPRVFTLRNTACEDATTVFYDAKADVRTAKDRLAGARESGNPKRIERAKDRLADAKTAKNTAKDDALEKCGTVTLPPRG